jgi:carboxymethylenebutenolidase
MAETVALTIGSVPTAAMVARPSGRGPFGGVVVTFYNEGLDTFTAWIVDSLAEAGFAAIAPNHYHVFPPGVDFTQRSKFLTDEQMAEDLAAAADWLRRQDGVDGKYLALTGPCMGGRTTLVGMEARPDLWRCGCAWYGGSAKKSLIGKMGPPASEERLRLLAAPLYGFFGSLDKNPSPQDVDELEASLSKLGKSHAFYRYEGADHGFLNPWSKRHHEMAAKDSWAKAIGFMRQHCTPPSRR